MTYKITRLEKSKDREGNYEVFISVNVVDEVGAYVSSNRIQGIELLPLITEDFETISESDLMLQKSSEIDAIVNSYIPFAKQNYLQSLEPKIVTEVI